MDTPCPGMSKKYSRAWGETSWQCFWKFICKTANKSPSAARTGSSNAVSQMSIKIPRDGRDMAGMWQGYGIMSVPKTDKILPSANTQAIRQFKQVHSSLNPARPGDR